MFSGQKRGITKRRLERSFKRQQAVELVITPPFQVLNLGAGNSNPLRVLILLIEEHLGIEAIKNYVAGPRGEMLETLADIEFIKNRIGFSPSVSLESAIARFVERVRWNRNC